MTSENKINLEKTRKDQILAQIEERMEQSQLYLAGRMQLHHILTTLCNVKR